jgi:hypothetical protein
MPLISIALLLLWGCSRPYSPPGVDSGVSVDGSGLELTLSSEPSGVQGWSVRLSPGDLTTIDRAASLTLHANLPLRNYRVRLLDEADRVLESDDQETKSGPDGMDYLIAPVSPLLAGHRYALVLDSQTPGVILDSSGRPLDEMRFELLTAGEREKPPAKLIRHGKRRHR